MLVSFDRDDNAFFLAGRVNTMLRVRKDLVEIKQSEIFNVTVSTSFAANFLGALLGEQNRIVNK